MTLNLASGWINVMARILIGAVFIYAGVVKMQDAQSFADSIATYRLFPDILINSIALSAPPFEIIAGSMLLLGWHIRAAYFATLVALVCFVLSLSQALVRGLTIDCGCFGSEAPAAWRTWLSLARDMALILVTGLLYMRAR